MKLNIHVNVFVIKSKMKSTYSFLSKGVNQNYDISNFLVLTDTCICIKNTKVKDMHT